MSIVQVIPKENHLLFVTTDDGQVGLFDVTPFLESEVFAPLRDRNEFERIHNGRYFIEWECGADLSADTIQAHLNPLANDGARQGVPADPGKAALLLCR
jgi:hypothetical protein